MRYRLVLPLLGLLLFMLGGIVYLWGTPRLVEVNPAPGDAGVSASAPLRLTFSRSMRDDEVSQSLTTVPSRPGSFSWDANTLIFTPDQPWPSGTIVTVSFAPGARAAGLLQLPLREGTTWSFTVRQTRLVYLAPTDAPADLYVLNLQTRETQRLTTAAAVTDFAANANGAALVYAASDTSGSGIYRLDLESGTATRLLSCPQSLCRNVAFSPHGDFLAYESTSLGSPGRESVPQVWLLPLQQDQPGAGTPLQVGDPASQTRQPVWSSQGVLAYYDYERAAFVFLDPTDGEIGVFADKTGNPGDWSPDGSQFITSVTFPGPPMDPNLLPDLSAIPSSHLVSYHLAERRETDLTRSNSLEDTFPLFSPNGRLVAFARRYLDKQRWTPGRQLWLMRATGEEALPLTNAPDYNHYGFVWSPDGERLAYVRFDENLPLQPPDIWLINADGSGALRIVQGGYAPLWIP